VDVATLVPADVWVFRHVYSIARQSGERHEC